MANINLIHVVFYALSGLLLALGWSMQKAGDNSFFIAGVLVMILGAGILYATLMANQNSEN